MRQTFTRFTRRLSQRSAAPLQLATQLSKGIINGVRRSYFKVKREYYRLLRKPIKVARYKQKLLALTEQINKSGNAPVTIGILTTKNTLFVAHAIDYALRNAGYPTVLMTEAPQTWRSLDLCFVLRPEMFLSLPPSTKYIAYEIKQPTLPHLFNDKTISKLQRALAVLDCSQVSLYQLEQHDIGYPQTFYVPIDFIENYNPYQVLIDSPDTDTSDLGHEVLFYGDPSSNRRQRLLRTLSSRFRTRDISQLFGAELYRMIKEAKVAVIPCEDGAFLEATKIYECLSIGTSVVSEMSFDMQEHEALRGLVDFVPVGDEIALLQAVDLAVGQPKRDFRSAARSGQARFRFMLYRAILALKLIDFNQFSALAPSYGAASDRFCLSLPETTVRRAHFVKHSQLDVKVFDGIRYSPSWIGCALSYKYLCRQATLHGLTRLFVCEDDVEFGSNFRARMDTVERRLDKIGTDWDVFCGLIAHLHPDVSVETVEQFEGETFVVLNRMTSMVFNIYNSKAIDLIAQWDPANSDVKTNTIDRYLESQTKLKIVTTLPFLVGHYQEMTSSLWGHSNRKYNALIAQSEALLRKKVDQFLAHRNQL